MKAATVALVIRFDSSSPALVEAVSDDFEIQLLESGVREGEKDPLKRIREHRERQVKEEEDFGNYVEELLSQPYLRPEIQEHGVQWLKSKIRIEQYQKSEAEAARIIAEYAYQVFAKDSKKLDFFLAGPKTQVRIRIFVVDAQGVSTPPQSQAA